MRWMAVVILIAALSVPVAAQAQPAAIDQVDQAVVLVSVIAESGGGTIRGSGSGIIIDPEGLILTANHVVSRARQIEVTLWTGDVLRARLMGTDPVYDVALIAVDPRGPLPAARLGSSASLQPGETLTALGRAPRRQGGATTGSFLILDHEARPGVPLLRALATVWPGDSGGALVNERGDVVGVIVAVTRDGTVSMAVAIDAVTPNLDALRAGTIRHAWLGVSGLTLTERLAQELGLAVAHGVLITEVIPGAPAAQAGLRGGASTAPGAVPRGGDIIVAVDGRPIPTFGTLAAYVLSRRIGETVTLEFIRDGQRLTASVVLGERPEI